MYTQLTQHLLEATALEADNKSDHRRKAQAFLVSKGIPEGLAEALSYSMEWAGDVKAACESSLREDMNTRINKLINGWASKEVLDMLQESNKVYGVEHVRRKLEGNPGYLDRVRAKVIARWEGVVELIRLSLIHI